MFFGYAVGCGDEVAGAFFCDVVVGESSESGEDFGVGDGLDGFGDVLVLRGCDHARQCLRWWWPGGLVPVRVWRMCADVVREQTAERLDSVLARMQSVGRLPSVSAGVVRGDGLVWSGAVGGVDGDVDPGAEVQYRIGSITKTFVAVLVLRLWHQGRLELGDRVDRFVPDTPFGDRTVQQLLTHTGGLSAEPPGPWWERSPGVSGEAMRAAWSGEQVLDRAGRAHHYSNLGFAVLGELVERVHERAWFEVLSAEVLEPLGMAATSLVPLGSAVRGWAVHPYADVLMPERVAETGWMAPAGQLWSTVADLARWVRFLAGDTGGVLPVEVVKQMREPQAVSDRVSWDEAAGLGVQLRRRGGVAFVGHGGSMPGFQAGLWVQPESRTGVVWLHNATTASPGGPGGLRLWEVLEECEPAAVRPWRPVEAVDADALALTGQWFWGPSVGVIRVLADGRLALEGVSGMMPSARFRREGVDVWRGEGAYFTGELLRVVRGVDGGVSHLDVGTFVLTRAPYEPGEVVPGGVIDGWPTR